MHDSANGIGAFVAYCAIYMIIMTTVLHSVFGLINFVPDFVLRWIGHPEARGMDQNDHAAEHVFVGAAQRNAGRPLEAVPKSKPSTGGGGGGGNTTQADHSQDIPPS